MTLERGPADSRDPVAPGSSRPTSPQGPDDRALVARVAGGDGGALEALYERYGRACYSLARRVLVDEQLAQFAEQVAPPVLDQEPHPFGELAPFPGR